MENSSRLKDLEEWGIFSKIPKSIMLKILDNFEYIELATGEELSSFNNIPPGIFYIKEGQIRLLISDESKELFTISQHTKGEIVGGEQILRGATDSSLTASRKTKGILLPIRNFLDLIVKFPDLYENFALIKPYELFSVLCRNQDKVTLKTTDLISKTTDICKKNYQVELLQPGKALLPATSYDVFVSSENVKDFPLGKKIIGSQSLEVIGKIPARLIFLKDEISIISKGNSNLEKDLVKNNRYKEGLRREALEDWYGRLHNDGTFPHQKGYGILDESLSCFRMLARYFDIPFRREVVRRVLEEQIKRSPSKELGLKQLAAVSQLLTLKPTPLKPSSTELLKRAPLPALTLINNIPTIIWQYKNSKFLISNPNNNQEWLKAKELESRIILDDIRILYIQRSSNSPNTRFGLSWFLPSIKKHRSSLIQVIIASFFVQLLGLFNPLLIQQIIDAVINQGNLSSLNILGTILVAMALAQAFLGSLRTYIFSDTTNRIDISLGSSIINHLLRLPFGYFLKRQVGEISSRLSELEKIREFLTGTALTVLLDAIFSIIYIAVMMIYSVSLTFLALAVIPFFIVLTLSLAPIIRRQIRKRAEANARVQSHLVEILSAMETVKGQGIELPSEWKWEQYYGSQIQAGFQNTVTSSAAGYASQFLSQISGLIVIWFGAILVLKGEMSIGQLIAFRILAGYVSTPILRLASLWQNFQETALSLERLSDIVDNNKEIDITEENLPPLPPIKGDITFEKVSFKYSEQDNNHISNINLNIKAGSFIGIVGSSGSGKSTLFKLLNRLFNANEGIIKIDGYDISKINLFSLRSQIGVVSQESVLFEDTIQSNIAIARPEASFDEIYKATKIAKADEFIQSLPLGYEYHLGERGSKVSGGQRQRLAIARTLLKKPNLLILDEATSCLDIDTENQLMRNIIEEYKNKTIIFITHRLINLKNADRIFVLHEGTLAEEGNHNELIDLGGRYATLCQQQFSNQN